MKEIKKTFFLEICYAADKQWTTFGALFLNVINEKRVMMYDVKYESRE